MYNRKVYFYNMSDFFKLMWPANRLQTNFFSVSVSVSFISAPPQEKQKEINKHIGL